MVVADVLQVIIFEVLRVLALVVLEVDLGVVETHQVVLLFLVAAEGGLVLDPLLLGVVEGHEVPHRDAALLFGTAECLSRHCSLEVEFVLDAAGQDAAIPRGPTHDVLVLVVGPEVLGLSRPAVGDACDAARVLSISVAHNAHLTLVRGLEVDRG